MGNKFIEWKRDSAITSCTQLDGKKVVGRHIGGGINNETAEGNDFMKKTAFEI